LLQELVAEEVVVVDAAVVAALFLRPVGCVFLFHLICRFFYMKKYEKREHKIPV